MLHIVGTITATTHIHQTAPDRDSNLNKTIKSRVWAADKTSRWVPFITANSVRGMLRRHAASILLDALNTPVTRSMYNVVTTGKASPTEIGLQATVPMMRAAATNVFAGLFGGGACMHRSRYSMAPLFPAVEWCARTLHHSVRESSMIPMDRLRYRKEDGVYADVDLTMNLILTTKDELLAGKGSRHIADYPASLEEYLKSVSEGRALKAGDKAAKAAAKLKGAAPAANTEARDVGLNGLNYLEAMLPGTPLQFWMRLMDTSDAQVGLMLLAVRNWANANVLGGASARGFGRFDAQLALYDGDQEIVPSLFNLSDHSTAYTLSADVARYVQAAEEALAAMMLEDLDLVYPTGDAAKKKKKGAAKPDADAAHA